MGKRALSFMMRKEVAKQEVDLPHPVLAARVWMVTLSRGQHSQQLPAAPSPPVPLLLCTSQSKLKAVQQESEPPLTTHLSEENPLAIIMSFQGKTNNCTLGNLYPQRCLPLASTLMNLLS